MTVNVIIPSITVIALGTSATLIYLLLHPEVAEKWAAVIYHLVYFLTKYGSKKIVKHDIQGKINTFAKVLAKEMANYEPVGINIQWVDKGETATDFFKDNKLVIRMRHHHDQDKNFVLASMVFISKSIMTKAKKYICNR